ncbi:hypothetical protein Kyoto68B_01870 [Helicobacter pylori]
MDNEIEIQKLGFEDKKDLDDYIGTYGNLISLENLLNREASDKEWLINTFFKDFAAH